MLNVNLENKINDCIMSYNSLSISEKIYTQQLKLIRNQIIFLILKKIHNYKKTGNIDFINSNTPFNYDGINYYIYNATIISENELNNINSNIYNFNDATLSLSIQHFYNTDPYYNQAYVSYYKTQNITDNYDMYRKSIPPYPYEFKYSNNNIINIVDNFTMTKLFVNFQYLVSNLYNSTFYNDCLYNFIMLYPIIDSNVPNAIFFNLYDSHYNNFILSYDYTILKIVDTSNNKYLVIVDQIQYILPELLLDLNYDLYGSKIYKIQNINNNRNYMIGQDFIIQSYDFDTYTNRVLVIFNYGVEFIYDMAHNNDLMFGDASIKVFYNDNIESQEIINYNIVNIIAYSILLKLTFNSPFIFPNNISQILIGIENILDIKKTTPDFDIQILNSSFEGTTVNTLFDIYQLINIDKLIEYYNSTLMLNKNINNILQFNNNNINNNKQIISFNDNYLLNLPSNITNVDDVMYKVMIDYIDYIDSLSLNIFVAKNVLNKNNSIDDLNSQQTNYLNYVYTDTYVLNLDQIPLSDNTTTTISNFLQYYGNVYQTNINKYQSKQNSYSTLVSTLKRPYYPYFRYIYCLGDYLMSKVGLWLGNIKIEEFTGNWINIFNNITFDKRKNIERGNIIGNSFYNLSYSRDKIAFKIWLDLPFSFSNNIGTAFPMIALANQAMKITLDLNTLNDIILFDSRANNDILIYIIPDGNTYDDTVYSLNNDLTTLDNLNVVRNVVLLNTKMYLEYIHLDSDERELFGKSRHEYLYKIPIIVDQIPITDISTPCVNKLPFTNSIYDMFFYINTTEAIKQKEYCNYTLALTNKYTTDTFDENIILYWDKYGNDDPFINVYFNYIAKYFKGKLTEKLYNQLNVSYLNLGTNLPTIYKNIFNTEINHKTYDFNSDISNIIDTVEFQMSGQKRFKYPVDYFDAVSQYKNYANNIPSLLSYSFSLHPNEFQPSGSLNFSLINDPRLIINFKKNSTSNIYNISADNPIYLNIIGRSYNYIRIMSGMGSLTFQL